MSFTATSQVVAFLTAEGVHEAIVGYFEPVKLDLAAFAAYFRQAEEIEEKCLDDLPEGTFPTKRDKWVAAAVLNRTWQKAVKMVSRGDARATSSTACDEDDDDAPLEEEEERQVFSTFYSHYKWDSSAACPIAIEQQGCPSLLGRLRREALRWKPTPFAVSKVRSTGEMVHKTQNKRTRLSEYFTLVHTQGDDGGSDKALLHLRDFEDRLQMLALTWAIAGCFGVDFKDEDMEKAGQVLYCHWAEASRYVFLVQQKIREEVALHSDTSILDWVTTMELATRERAIEYSRLSMQRVPWGRALLRAFKSMEVKWSTRRDMLTSRGSNALRGLRSVKRSAPLAPAFGGQQRNTRARTGPKGKNTAPAKGGKGRGAGKNRAADSGKNANAPSLLTRLRDDGDINPSDPWVYCQSFNGRKGCSRGACQFKHSCSAKLASTGLPCDRSDHGAAGHISGSHGATA